MDSYETVKKNGLEKRRKKCHVTTILGIQIVLYPRITPIDMHDTNVLGPMIEMISEQEVDVDPSTGTVGTIIRGADEWRTIMGSTRW